MWNLWKFYNTNLWDGNQEIMGVFVDWWKGLQEDVAVWSLSTNTKLCKQCDVDNRIIHLICKVEFDFHLVKPEFSKDYVKLK